MCTEYHIQDNMYYASAQGVDEHMINVQYYYYTHLFFGNNDDNSETLFYSAILPKKKKCAQSAVSAENICTACTQNTSLQASKLYAHHK